jgi:hypothetical protein
MLLLLISCSGGPLLIHDSLLNGDVSLPCLVDTRSLDERNVELVFSEPVSILWIRSANNPVTESGEEGCRIRLRFSKALPILYEEIIRLAVRDEGGNTASLALGVRGCNPHIPNLLITEFLSRGTETQPNRIEFEALTSGSLSGLYLADGAKGYENFSYVFPDEEVQRGQYIVIYINSTPTSDEFERLESRNVLVLNAKCEKSFPQYNGMCVLYDTKLGMGRIIDALVYNSNTATTFGGWGNEDAEKSYNALLAANAWTGPAVDSEKATSTRTLCRYSGKTDDTDSAFDFYIAETRTSSFGERNKDIVYTGK